MTTDRLPCAECERDCSECEHENDTLSYYPNITITDVIFINSDGFVSFDWVAVPEDAP